MVLGGLKQSPQAPQAGGVRRETDGPFFSATALRIVVCEAQECHLFSSSPVTVTQTPQRTKTAQAHWAQVAEGRARTRGAMIVGKGPRAAPYMASENEVDPPVHLSAYLHMIGIGEDPAGKKKRGALAWPLRRRPRPASSLDCVEGRARGEARTRAQQRVAHTQSSCRGKATGVCAPLVRWQPRARVPAAARPC